MESLSEKIHAVVARCIERQNDPEFQAQARRLAEENAEAEKLCRETERKMALHSSGVPMSLWDKVLSPDPTPALDAARTFLATPGANAFLTLSGPRGRGKTFAAGWCVAERGGRFIEAHALVHAGTFDPVWRELMAAPVVALDELGAEHMNDAYRSSLYGLLNARYANERKTVLVTNLDANQFRARYCPGAEDRLHERLRTAGTWVSLPGDSMRTHWSERDGE